MEHTAAKVSITSLPKSIVRRIVSNIGFHPLPSSPGPRELESDKLKPAAAMIPIEFVNDGIGVAFAYLARLLFLQIYVRFSPSVKGSP